VGFKVTGIKVMTLFITRRLCGVLFSLGFYDIAALSPWELNVLYSFRLAAISKLL
jgi:hypothetical protein